MKKLLLLCLILLSQRLSAQVAYMNYFNAGADLAAAGKYKEAVVQFDSSIMLFDKYHLAYYDRGLSKFSLQDYDGALLDMNAALRLKPDFVTALYWRAYIFDQKGQEQLCVNDIDKALSVGSGSFALYSLRALALYKMKDYAGALNDYKQAEAFGIDNQEIYYPRGMCHYYLNQMAAASADMEKYVALHPDKAEAIEIGIRSSIATGNLDKALQYADKFGALPGLKNPALNYKGIIHYTQGQYEKTIKDYTQLIAGSKSRPELADAYYNRATAYVALQKKKEACEDYHKAYDNGYKGDENKVHAYCQ